MVEPESNPERGLTLKYGTDLAGIYSVEKAEREELEIAYQTLNAVFASTPDGLLVLDDALIIQQANRAFGHLVEMSPELVVGRLLAEVFEADELTSAVHRLAMDATAPTQVELTVNTPVKRSLLANIARLQTKRSQGWIVVLHEQSERKRLEYQKYEFINIAAHELRTPLTAILGYTELLVSDLAGAIDDDRWEYLLAIKEGSYRLLGVINELLEFAQLHEGEVETKGVAEFGLAELLEGIVLDLQQHANKHFVNLALMPADPPITLFTDAKLLRAALHQLVLNSINFNKAGGYVRISAVSEDDLVSIEVADSGIGIPQAEMEAIFGPFIQVEDHNTRHVNGLGLGLAIARRAAAQLGGTLSAESTLGQGTTFCLRIPVGRPDLNPELAELRARLEASNQQSLVYARGIQRLQDQLQRHFLATLTAMTQAIEARDGYTRGHTERVTALALSIARKMHYSEQALRTLETAGRLHDIGKIGTPDDILNNSGPLSDQEYAIVQQHVALGRRILEPFEFLREVIPIAFSHHERWDGKGYPNGLAGEAIPLGGRILAVADAYHAMTSPRSYREAIPRERALAIIQDGAGTQWDPDVVTVFLSLFET